MTISALENVKERVICLKTTQRKILWSIMEVCTVHLHSITTIIFQASIKQASQTEDLGFRSTIVIKNILTESNQIKRVHQKKSLTNGWKS